ncbi:MAG: hemin uptake protein HemP [Phycisphaerae bacterium]|nr:hemin uptake protein HemP [Phycisphaerae bacterium]
MNGSSQQDTGQAGGDRGTDRPAEAAPVIDSQNLFTHGQEITIRHGQELYRLRITRNDKLILTK